MTAARRCADRPSEENDLRPPHGHRPDPHTEGRGCTPQPSPVTLAALDLALVALAVLITRYGRSTPLAPEHGSRAPCSFPSTTVGEPKGAGTRMGFFRPRPPPPRQEAFTLDLTESSFTNPEGERVDGQGYQFFGENGEPLFDPLIESVAVAHLEGLVTKVAGVSHHAVELQHDAFEPGQPLRLAAEPNNPYDPNAVSVWDANGSMMVGHLPRVVAVDVSAAMRAGLSRDALSLWEWRTESQGRIGLRILIAPGIAAAPSN